MFTFKDANDPYVLFFGFMMGVLLTAVVFSVLPYDFPIKYIKNFIKNSSGVLAIYCAIVFSLFGIAVAFFGIVTALFLLCGWVVPDLIIVTFMHLQRRG